MSELPAGETESSGVGRRRRVYRAVCKTLADRAGDVDWLGLSDPDWKVLIRMADAQGVAPLVHRDLERQGWLASAPDEIRARLNGAYYSTLARNTLLYRELERVLAALEEAGVPVVVLKGAALAASLYPDVGLRPMGDLDLLVPRRRLRDAWRAVQRMGYRVEKTSQRVVLRGGPQGSVVLELHWSLVPGDSHQGDCPLDWLWNETESFEGEGAANALALAPGANLLYLAAHLMLQHRGNPVRLVWFYDVHLLVSRWIHRLDWEELEERARAFRWETSLYASLEGARECFDTPLAGSVLDAFNARSREQSPGEPDVRGESAVGRVLGSLTALDWRARLSLVWRMAFPSPSYVQQRYAPRRWWLWPLSYLCRWWDIALTGLPAVARLVWRQRVRRAAECSAE